MNKFHIKTRYTGTYHNTEDLILKRSGIDGEKRDFFLKPNHSKDYDFEPIDLPEGIDLLNKHIKQQSTIGLLIDPDVDGYTSAAMMYKILQKKDVLLYTYQQEGKEHGLTEFVMTDIIKDEIDLLIVTDAGSNDIEGHRILHENNIDVLVIDHHQIENEDEWILKKEIPVINNHRCDNPIPLNPELTGAGMTLRFLEEFNGEYLYDLYYLAALGQIGDSSDIAEPEIRNIVIKGIGNIPDDTLISYILSKEFSQGYSQRDMAFSINPYINALVRVGTMEEKDFVFSSLVSDDENTYEEGYRILKRVKSRQKTVIDRMKEDLVGNVNNDGGIAVGYVENPENKTVVGLVANNLVRSLNKPVLLLRDNDDGELSGSGRGLERVIPSLKNWCKSTNLTNFVGGHDNAFGLGINKDNWEDLLQATKDIEELDYVYDVDNIYDYIDKNIVEDYHNVNQFIGGSIEDVRVGFSAIEIDKKQIISRGSVTLLKKNGVEFIIFNDFGKVANELSQGFGNTVILDIVGKPNINVWAGREQHQVIVEDVQRASGDLLYEDVVLPKHKIDVDLIEF